jgi:hypothetical protein
MHLRLAAPAAVLALVGATVPAVATGTTGVTFAAAHVVRGALGPAAGAPQRWAAKALRDHAERLGVDASAYRVESVRTSLIGSHVRGRQFRGDVPVQGTDFLVTALHGQVAQVDAFGSELPGQPVAQPVGDLVARAAALNLLQVTALLAPVTVDRILVPREGRLVDTYRVSLVASRPAVVGTVDVDAATGRVLAVRDDARRIDAEAKVFDPNPIQRSGNAKLRQAGVDLGVGPDTDLDSAEVNATRTMVPMKGLDPAALQTTRLAGPWVNVLGIAGYVATGDRPVFDLTKGDPRFEGLMAYAHLDGYQRYLQGLGFRGAKGVNAEQQDIVATRVEGFDNSFYQPRSDLMLLGAGGVDDGEDAEVILHEYGHAMQDAQVTGWGATAEGGAMGEGFGDFNAANYFARTSRGAKWDLCIAEWDATTYSSSNPTCLRRMDSKKRYPKDVADEVHDDGELWSAFLWRVRSHLKGNAVQKSDAATRLVVSSHELLTPNAAFDDAVAALRTAARALKHPEWARFIDAEAKRTGFALNP